MGSLPRTATPARFLGDRVVRGQAPSNRPDAEPADQNQGRPDADAEPPATKGPAGESGHLHCVVSLFVSGGFALTHRRAARLLLPALLLSVAVLIVGARRLRPPP